MCKFSVLISRGIAVEVMGQYSSTLLMTTWSSLATFYTKQLFGYNYFVVLPSLFLKSI